MVGQGGSPTGFARVIHSVLQHLPDGWDLHHLATDLHQQTPPDCGWHVHVNPEPRDPLAEQALSRLLPTLRPDIVFILGEPWMGARLALVLAQRPATTKAVWYAAIDADDVLPADVLEAISGLDRIVTYTRFGAACLARSAKCQEQHTPTFQLPPIETIPHGVDTAVFTPLDTEGRPASRPDRHAARRRLLPGRDDLDDAFIVLNANRNQPKKRIDICLDGFARFARDKGPSVRLYLHMGSRQRPAGQVALVDQLGIRDRVLASTTGPRHPAVPSATLNEIYNACNVGLNTSEGEGWGLVAFEHAATGAAQIVPEHSACAELWRDAAQCVPPVAEDRRDGNRRKGKTVDADAVAEALEVLYRDPVRRRSLARAGYDHATQSTYDWRRIAERWDALFRSALQDA